MDFGQIIYIVAIVAYFIYKASSKKKTEALPESGEGIPEPPKKGFTFEELLKEIREAQTSTIPQSEQEPVLMPKPKPSLRIPQQDRPISQPTFFKEEIVSEGLDYEQSNLKPKTKQVYSDEKAPSAPSDKAKTIFYELYAERRNPYAELLKNPKSIRDAIVVSEILKPKHF